MSIQQRLTVLAVIVFLWAIGIAGDGDLAEAERIQAEYCANVESGGWPDYKGTYSESCR
jgi:hypothetical protein